MKKLAGVKPLLSARFDTWEKSILTFFFTQAQLSIAQMH